MIMKQSQGTDAISWALDKKYNLQDDENDMDNSEREEFMKRVGRVSAEEKKPENETERAQSELTGETLRRLGVNQLLFFFFALEKGSGGTKLFQWHLKMPKQICPSHRKLHPKRRGRLSKESCELQRLVTLTCHFIKSPRVSHGFKLTPKNKYRVYIMSLIIVLVVGFVLFEKCCFR